MKRLLVFLCCFALLSACSTNTVMINKKYDCIVKYNGEYKERYEVISTPVTNYTWAPVTQHMFDCGDFNEMPFLLELLVLAATPMVMVSDLTGISMLGNDDYSKTCVRKNEATTGYEYRKANLSDINDVIIDNCYKLNLEACDDARKNKLSIDYKLISKKLKNACYENGDEATCKNAQKYGNKIDWDKVAYIRSKIEENEQREREESERRAERRSEQRRQEQEEFNNNIQSAIQTFQSSLNQGLQSQADANRMIAEAQERQREQNRQRQEEFERRQQENNRQQAVDRERRARQEEERRLANIRRQEAEQRRQQQAEAAIREQQAKLVNIPKTERKKQSGRWVEGSYRVTAWGSDKMFVNSYVYACVTNKSGDPSFEGQYLSISNTSSNKIAQYATYGTSGTLAPGSKKLINIPFNNNKGTNKYKPTEYKVNIRYIIEE